MIKTVFLAVVLLLLQGCGGGGNSTPLTDSNTTDTTALKFTSSNSVSVAENQTRAITLQTNGKNSITYSISGIDADSFMVDKNSGVVTFKTAPNYEEKDSYTFTATATDADGNTATQDVVVNITDIVEPFVMVWETTSANQAITIPTDSNNTYNYTIDWGDGTIEEGVAGDATHTYSSEGNWTIKISGEFPHMQMEHSEALETMWHAGYSNIGDVHGTAGRNLRKVLAWGDIKWKDMSRMFAFAYDFTLEASDKPILKDVESMRFMFLYALKFNSYIGDWNVSHIKDMRFMFKNAVSFNQDISNWDVSNVEDMMGMFYGEDTETNHMAFNQDISNWDVSSVTNMYGMFWNARAFNQDISNWNTSSVKYMSMMFAYATSFKDQDLSSWNVANVISHDDFSTGTGGNIIEPNWP